MTPHFPKALHRHLALFALGSAPLVSSALGAAPTDWVDAWHYVHELSLAVPDEAGVVMPYTWTPIARDEATFPGIPTPLEKPYLWEDSKLWQDYQAFKASSTYVTESRIGFEYYFPRVDPGWTLFDYEGTRGYGPIPSRMLFYPFVAPFFDPLLVVAQTQSNKDNLKQEYDLSISTAWKDYTSSDPNRTDYRTHPAILDAIAKYGFPGTPTIGPYEPGLAGQLRAMSERGDSEWGYYKTPETVSYGSYLQASLINPVRRITGGWNQIKHDSPEYLWKDIRKTAGFGGSADLNAYWQGLGPFIEAPRLPEVDIADRDAVTQFVKDYDTLPETPVWTGYDLASGTPGTVRQQDLLAYARRINFFRSFAGVLQADRIDLPASKQNTATAFVYTFNSRFRARPATREFNLPDDNPLVSSVFIEGFEHVTAATAFAAQEFAFAVGDPRKLVDVAMADAMMLGRWDEYSESQAARRRRDLLSPQGTVLSVGLTGKDTYVPQGTWKQKFWDPTRPLEYWLYYEATTPQPTLPANYLPAAGVFHVGDSTQSAMRTYEANYPVRWRWTLPAFAAENPWLAANSVQTAGVVTWPPAGYVPYNLVFPRWSVAIYGLPYNNAAEQAYFSILASTVAAQADAYAVVDERDRAVPVQCNDDETFDVLAIGNSAASEELVNHPKPAFEKTYRVRMKNLTIGPLSPKMTTVPMRTACPDLVYDVTVFDPNAPAENRAVIPTSYPEVESLPQGPWYGVRGFGRYYSPAASRPWVWHAGGLGWLYTAQPRRETLGWSSFFYDATSKHWFWTKESLFPWLYDYSLSTWTYFEKVGAERWFWRADTKTWEVR